MQEIRAAILEDVSRILDVRIQAYVNARLEEVAEREMRCSQREMALNERERILNMDPRNCIVSHRNVRPSDFTESTVGLIKEEPSPTSPSSSSKRPRETALVTRQILPGSSKEGALQSLRMRLKKEKEIIVPNVPSAISCEEIDKALRLAMKKVQGKDNYSEDVFKVLCDRSASNGPNLSTFIASFTTRAASVFCFSKIQKLEVRSTSYYLRRHNTEPFRDFKKWDTIPKEIFEVRVSGVQGLALSKEDWDTILSDYGVLYTKLGASADEVIAHMPDKATATALVHDLQGEEYHYVDRRTGSNKVQRISLEHKVSAMLTKY